VTQKCYTRHDPIDTISFSEGKKVAQLINKWKPRAVSRLMAI
jgi:hypothetical protein